MITYLKFLIYFLLKRKVDFSPLKLYESSLTKRRLGRRGDGGYVICDLKDGYDLLLSGGVGDDISFEIDFLNYYKTNAFVYDHTVKKLPQKCEKLQFRKEKVSLNSWVFALSSHRNIFIKMDIEGGEYPLFRDLPKEYFRNIKQCVIEFHDIYKEENLKVLDRFLDTHVILHAHANNCCGTTMVDRSGSYRKMGYDTNIPLLIELTLVRKKDVGEFWPNSKPLPTIIDYKNVSFRPDVYLDKWPFVWEKKYE